MAAKTAELLKCSETDFDKNIQEMSLKDLLDAISLLQKEMTREQENFNSLGTELGALNKNSQQYKQISKEMNQSQSRLTILMNRSMKCFQQQGNQQSKQKPGINQVQRRNSAKTTQNDSTANVQRRHSAKIKGEEADTLKTSIDKSTVKSTPNLDSTNQSKPVILKPLSTLDTSKFDLKKTEPARQNHSSSVVVNSQINSVQQNGNMSNKIEQKTDTNPQKSVTVIKAGLTNPTKFVAQNDVKSSGTTSQPSNVSSLSIKNPSQQSTNRTGLTEPQVKSTSAYLQSTQNNTSALQNTTGAVQNTTSAVQNTTSAVQNNTSTATVIPIKINGLAPQKQPQKLLKSCDDQPSGGNLLEQIRNFKKTSESDDVSDQSKPKQNFGKVEEVRKIPEKNKTEQKVVKEFPKQSQEEKPPVIFHGGRPVLLDSNVEQGRKVLLDQIKSHRKSETQGENIAKLEEEKKPVALSNVTSERVNKPVTKIEHNGDSKIEVKPRPDSQVEVKPRTNELAGKVSMATISLQRNSREIKVIDQPKSETVPKQAEKVEPVVVSATKKADDEETNRASPSLEQEKYRSEFSFPSKPVAAAINTATSKPVPQAATASKENTEPQQQKELENAISQEEATGVPVQTGAEDEEVAPKRINLRDWDPHLLLKDLYRIEMVKDDVEDISDKFVSMEGLMEKLPMNKKKATLLKTWKRRFFRATDGWLHYYETSNRDKPSDSIQLMGGRVDDLGNRILGIDDGRGRYLMVRCPTDNEYGQWKLALDTQTADNVKATYIRPKLLSPPHSSKKIIVIDLGSCAIRAGILGQEETLPQVFFPSVIAKERNTGKLVVGEDAYKPEVRHKSVIQRPVRPTNKDDKLSIDMEAITEVFKTVFQRLQVKDINQYWVMLSTPQTLGDKLKTDLMKILVEQFHTQGVCMVQQSLLALYSYNATSGVIVDIGERMEILPIYDGYVIEGGVSRQSYGGQKVGDSLKSSLIENKYKFLTPVEQFIVRYIMEQSCCVAANYKEAVSKCEKDPESCRATVYMNNYDLPEEAHLSVTHDLSCFKSPEGFFNTDMWGMDYPCVHKLVFQAIQSCPIDSRKHMYRSVYLSGGVTVLPGFAERLQAELTKMAPPAVVVEVHGSPQRYHASFIGACAMAKMAPTEQTFISADEWKRLGQKAFKKWSMSG